MISGVLFKKEIKTHYRLLLLFLAVLTMYAWVITAMFDPALGDGIAALASSMPELFALFGMANQGNTLLDFLANYLYGFLLMVFPLVFIMILSNHLVSRYVESGAMAYLLATPVRRGRLVRTQGLVLLFSILLMALYVTGLTIALSAVMFPGVLEVPLFLRLNLGWLGLMVFQGGLCFMASCLFNDGKGAYGLGAGANIAFVLLQMITQAGDRFSYLKYANPYSLFDPFGLIGGDGTYLGYAAILFGVGLLMGVLGMWAFSRRDLPL